MRIPVGITLIVLGAILTFALKGGHIGNLDLHAVGVILIRNRSRFSRTTIRSRRDIVDDGTRTVVNHADGSQTVVEHDDGAQTVVEHDDGAQTFAEPFDVGPSLADPSVADPSLNGGRTNHSPRRSSAGSAQS